MLADGLLSRCPTNYQRGCDACTLLTAPFAAVKTGYAISRILKDANGRETIRAGPPHRTRAGRGTAVPNQPAEESKLELSGPPR